MAKKVEIDIDVNTGKVNDSIGQLKALKKQLKDTAAGSDDFSKLQHQITELEINIKGAKKAGSDWIASLEGAGGPLGTLGKALGTLKSSTVSFGAALKATGIGLVVAAIGGLVGAFAETDGAMKKLEPLMIAMQKILGGILEAMMPLIDAFIDLATQALPYITQGIKVFYSSLVALFTLVKEAGSGVGKILKGIFTLDTKSIKEGYSQLTGTWDKTVQSFDASEKRFDEGYKKQTKTQKENADKSRELLLKKLEAQDKYDEAMLEKMKQSALALATTEQEKLDVEIAFAKKSYELKNAEIDKKIKAEKKGSAEVKALQAEKIANEADYLSKTTGFAEQQKKINEDELKAKKDFEEKAKEIKAAAVKDDLDRAIAMRDAKYEKDLSDLEKDKEFIKKSEGEKNELRLALATAHNNDIAKLKADDAVKKLQDQLMIDEAQLKVLQEGTTEYFAQQRKIENDAYELKLKAAKDNEDQITAIKLEHAANNKNIDRAEFEARKALQSQMADLYGSFGKSLQEIAGKNKGLAIAGLIVEQAAGIAKIIINTQVAASKFGYLTPMGIATLVAGAASVVAAVVATKRGIDQINATQIPGGGGGGGSLSASAAPPPAYGGSGGGASASIPTMNGVGGANPATQISQTIQNASSQPVRAYVVSADISNQQQLDRRANKGATFANG